MRTDFAFIERMLSKLNFTDGCWEWRGAIAGNGYPHMFISEMGKTQRVHRLMAEYVYGDVEGKVIMHTCDNRWCVNPSHLVVGTQKENMRDHFDKVKLGVKPSSGIKRTWKRKAANGTAWRRDYMPEGFNESLRELYASGMECKDIARRLGCSLSTVLKRARKLGLTGYRKPGVKRRCA